MNPEIVTDGFAGNDSPMDMTIDPLLLRIVEAQPYPLLFATISGAHLYGFRLRKMTVRGGVGRGRLYT